MPFDRVGISAVIPTRDRPTALRRAVASVLTQTQPAAEVVVVDDGSVPPVDSAAIRDAPIPIRVIRNAVPRGPAAARNLGVANAASEYVAFLDDDDLWHPRKLELVGQGLAEHPGVDVAVHATGTDIAETGTGEWRVVGDPVSRMLHAQPPHIGGVTVRRALHHSTPFNELLSGAEDLDYLIALAKADARIIEISKTLAVHGRRGPSAVALEARIQGRLKLLHKHPEILSDPNARSFFYLRLGHQYRRAGQRARAIRSFARSLEARRNTSALKGLVLSAIPIGLQRRLLNREGTTDP